MIGPDLALPSTIMCFLLNVVVVPGVLTIKFFIDRRWMLLTTGVDILWLRLQQSWRLPEVAQAKHAAKMKP